MFAALALFLLASGPVPFTLVNGTGAPLSGISTRLSGSSGEWRPLGHGQLPPNARGAVPALGGEDCAWDIRAEAGGSWLVWADVNLCDVKSVTLRRRDGTLWVDYD